MLDSARSSTDEDTILQTQQRHRRHPAVLRSEVCPAMLSNATAAIQDGPCTMPALRWQSCGVHVEAGAIPCARVRKRTRTLARHLECSRQHLVAQKASCMAVRRFRVSRPQHNRHNPRWLHQLTHGSSKEQAFGAHCWVPCSDCEAVGPIFGISSRPDRQSAGRASHHAHPCWTPRTTTPAALVRKRRSSFATAWWEARR